MAEALAVLGSYLSLDVQACSHALPAHCLLALGLEATSAREHPGPHIPGQPSGRPTQGVAHCLLALGLAGVGVSS